MTPPTYWTLNKDKVEAARTALRAGLENTQELLNDYDARLGRTTRSNRHTAERLEGEIREMKSAIDALDPPTDDELDIAVIEARKNEPTNPADVVFKNLGLD
tara:strand:+ start:918 stop:1223 length:306 start_codon:yes stop_codon:yes gene_type:complete